MLRWLREHAVLIVAGGIVWDFLKVVVPPLAGWGGGYILDLIAEVHPMVPVIVGIVICAALFFAILKHDKRESDRREASQRLEYRREIRFLDARDKLQQSEIDELRRRQDA